MKYIISLLKNKLGQSTKLFDSWIEELANRLVEYEADCERRIKKLEEENAKKKKLQA